MRFPLSLFSKDTTRALEQFRKFNQEQNKDRCLEYDDRTRLNDKEAVELIKQVVKVKSPAEVLNFEMEKRNEVIKNLKKRGLSIRQIQRLTGVSFPIIRKL